MAGERKHKRRPGRLLLVGVAVLLGLMAFGAFVTLHRQPTLLKIATRLTPPGQAVDSPHQWLSSHEVGFIVPSSQKAFVLDMCTSRTRIYKPTMKLLNVSTVENIMRVGEVIQAPRYWDAEVFEALQHPPTISTLQLPPEERLQVQSVQGHLPQECNVEDLISSPDGKQIAYFLLYTRLAPVDFLLHRLLPHWKTHSHTVLALYVSDLNGEHMREVAWQSVPTTAAPINPSINMGFYSGPPIIFGACPGKVSSCYGLRWVPDGKHVSFTYNNTLSMVPVE